MGVAGEFRRGLWLWALRAGLLCFGVEKLSRWGWEGQCNPKP